MINLVAFCIAAVVYLLIWATGVHGLTAALIPALIIISAAAAYTYIPLIKKTIHGEDHQQ
jgi:hypothetical protein